MSKDPVHLARLQDYYADHGVFPPYSTIGQLLGLRSKSSVAALVGRLTRSGHLQATDDRRLKPGPRFFERALGGQVRAGMPEPVDSRPPEPVNLDRLLVRHPSRTLLIQVKGDSMRGAGIHPGDIAVVEQGVEARPGDLVVAWVDNEYTLKTLAKAGDRYILKAANPNYPDILPAGELSILGVVKALARSYH